MNAEIDLPRRFLAMWRPTIERWLEGAIPGHTLCIALGPTQLLHPAVSAGALEKRTIELRATELARGVLLVRSADRFSERLVDHEEARLAAAERVAASIHTLSPAPKPATLAISPHGAVVNQAA